MDHSATLTRNSVVHAKKFVPTEKIFNREDYMFPSDISVAHPLRECED